jgi:hypothetical protein
MQLLRTTSAMEPQSWSESISVPSVDAEGSALLLRRLTSVCRGQQDVLPGWDVRRRDGVHFGLAPLPSGFAESAICYVGKGDSTSCSRRHYRSTVRYEGATRLRAQRFYETCYVIPRSPGDDVTFTSLVESQPAAKHSKTLRWYSSALKLVPKQQAKPSTTAASDNSVILADNHQDVAIPSHNFTNMRSRSDNSDGNSNTDAQRRGCTENGIKEWNGKERTFCDENENISLSFSTKLVVNGGSQHTPVH